MFVARKYLNFLDQPSFLVVARVTQLFRVSDYSLIFLKFLNRVGGGSCGFIGVLAISFVTSIGFFQDLKFLQGIQRLFQKSEVVISHYSISVPLPFVTRLHCHFVFVCLHC